MQPTLGISYNSQANVGLLGMGWNLTAGSNISRVNTDIYHDGSVSSPDLMPYDAFMLDGNRLILEQGSYGLPNSEYKTKTESFSRIMATSFNGKLAFTVEDKSGLIREYGMSADSRITNAAGDAIIWELNKVTDKFGNYFQYKYISINDIRYLDEILYTGNSTLGIAPYNSIKFDYAYRTDKNITYMTGVPLQANLLLTKITIKAEGAVFSTYDFNYVSDDIHSYLREAKLADSNGKYVNSTLFKYGDKPTIKLEVKTTSVNSNGKSCDIFTGEYNGDGKTDIILGEFSYRALGTSKIYEKLSIYCSDDLGNNFIKTDDIDIPAAEQSDYFKNSSNFNFLSQDSDGDGLDDIFRSSKEKIFVPAGGTPPVSFTAIRLNSVKLHKSKGGGKFDLPFDWKPNKTFNLIDGWPNNNSINPSTNFFYSGDFNGDSRVDYISTLSNGTRFKAFFTSPGPGTAAQNEEIDNKTNSLDLAAELVSSDAVYTIDMDGDGKNELLRIKGDAVVKGNRPIYPCEIYEMHNKGRDVYLLSGLTTLTNKQNLFFGDFNGDRKTDVLVKEGNVNSWKIWYSDGQFFVNPQTFTFTNGIPNLSAAFEKLRVNDFNGDGLADIGYMKSASPTSKIDIYYNTGSSFFLDKITTNEPIGATLEMGDFNGDGKGEFINRITHSDPVKIFRIAANATNHLLEKVVDGFNREVSFKYAQATTGNVFTKGTGLTYPLNNVLFPMTLASELTQPDGANGTTKTTYHYTDAWLHRQGLGFLGFGKVNSENTLVSNNVTYKSASESIFEIKTFFDEDDLIYKAFYPYLYQSKSTIGGITSTTTNNNELIDQGKNRWWLRPTSTTSVNGLTGATTVQEYTTYDDTYGDVTDQIVKLNTDYETLRTETTYEQRGLISVPTLTTVTKKRKEDSNNFVAKTKRTFGTKGELLSEKVFDGSPNNSITTVFEGYNDFGQPQFKKVTGTTKPGSLETRITEYAYSANGRFVLGTKNPLYQTSGVTMDPKWGKPLTMTPISGIETTNTYDGFGRLKTSLSLPHTVASTISYQWGLANDPFLYKVVSTSQGSPTSTEYFDKLERSIKKETIDLNGITLVTETTYDARGNVATTTSPHHTTGSYTGYLTTTNTYDALNRVTNVAVLAVVPTTNPPTPAPTPIPPTTIVHSTNGLTVRTTSPGGKWSEQVSDVSGKVVETSDAGGVLKMTYFSHGGQKDVKMQGTAVVLSLMTYDDIGRQITMTEPNSGISSYLYNAFGELIEQQIAGGEQVIFTYNKLGQLATRKNMGLGSTTTYAYYDATTGSAKTNALKSVTGFANHSMLYDYDAYGRMTLQTETIKGTPFTKSFTYYPITSELKNVIFPNGVVQENVYDGNGYMTEVKVAAAATPTTFTSVWKEAKRDGFGNYREYKMGTKTSTMTYDAYGFPINYTTPGVQNLDFKFEEKNGNLKYREDKIKNKKEDFTYDNLERLLTATVVGQAGMTMQYADNGNISFKTGLTDYTYDPLKIHAVKRVENYPTDLNRSIQNVTYTVFHQASKITEKFKQAGQANWTETIDIEYGSDYERRYAKYNGNSKHIDYDIYYLGDYEEIKPQYAPQSTKINYIYGGDGLCAMVVDEGAGNQINYVYKDYLGSILTLTDATGAIKCEQSFDAWGRRRNATDWTYTNPISSTHPYWLYRGYTGHEHYDRLSGIVLINMNARIYDPVNGRMLRWDIAIGAGTQGMNRYSYANNNPLKYTDPTGNFPILIAAAIGAAVFGIGNLAAHAIAAKDAGENLSFKQGARAFFTGAVAGAALGAGVALGLGVPVLGPILKVAGLAMAGSAVFSVASSLGQSIVSGSSKPLGNALKLLAGHFYLDENKGPGAAVWEGISRYSWQLIQTTIGSTTAHITSGIGRTKEVGYFGGATFTVTKRDHWGGITLGNNIFLDGDSDLALNDATFQHEYGHYIQSQNVGPLYYFTFGLPSAIHAKWGKGSHILYKTEQDANIRALKYLNKHENGNFTWQSISNPISDPNFKLRLGWFW